MREHSRHVSDEFLITKKFSPREIEILRLAATGHDAPSIAKELHLKKASIMLYLRNIKIKTNTLGTRDKSTPIFFKYALDLGVINKEEILASCNPEGFALLKDREKEILGFVREGLTQPEIGKELFISARTVKKDMLMIRQKTGLRPAKHHAVALSLVMPEEFIKSSPRKGEIIHKQRSKPTTIYKKQ